MIRLCILDFDGTLCATHDAITHCLQLTFEHYGHARPTLDRLDTAIRSGSVMTDAIAWLANGAVNADEAREWAATYRQFYLRDGLERSRIFPGVEAGLAQLRAAGISLVIASNKALPSVEKAIAHYGIAAQFELLVCDPPDIPKKPDPAAYREIIQPAYPQIAPHEIAMLGDTQADLGFARGFGGVACWARYGYGDLAQCESMQPDLTVDHFTQFVEHVMAHRA